MVMESLDAFRQRARDWLAGNLPRLPADAQPWNGMRVGTDEARRAKELQALLFEAGFAGLCFPKEYGGQGLAPEYQRAFGDEARVERGESICGWEGISVWGSHQWVLLFSSTLSTLGTLPATFWES